jgi:hypothetical protein
MSGRLICILNFCMVRRPPRAQFLSCCFLAFPRLFEVPLKLESHVLGLQTAAETRRHRYDSSR